MAHSCTARSRVRRLTARPGWPLTTFVAGYGLWWLLGIAELLLPVVAAVLAFDLLRRHEVRVRRGFGVWLMFLAWVVAGVLVLQVDAPGARPGSSDTRYLTFGFRVLLYLSATVLLVYIYNSRDRLSTDRILRAFAWFFVTVVAGGVLGTAAPHLAFPSAIELVLPHGVTHVQFVHDLVHPVVAQLHQTGGVVNPRASAPFAYTNDWGLMYPCLLPFFLVAWSGRSAARWQRRTAPLVLLVSIYPVVMSQNRGMWLALAVSAALVAVRAAVLGRTRVLLGVLAGAVVVGAVVLATPLGSTIQDRLGNPGSETGRSSLGAQTIASVTAKSPVIGLGTTRDVQGSYYSIAGGDSPSCDGCGPPPLGTQGHFWLVVYSTGYLGLVLYLGFILYQLARHARLRSPVAAAGLTVLVVHLVTMVVYDTIGIGLATIFAAIGLLHREAARIEGRPGDVALGRYFRIGTAGGALVAVCVVGGCAGGVAFRAVSGSRYQATASVLVPRSPQYPGSTGTQSMDTIAQLAHSPRVTGALGVLGSPRLDVTAIANTRVLQLQVTADTPEAARRAADAAGNALLATRAATLDADRRAALRAAQARRAASTTSLTTIATVAHDDRALATALTGQRDALVQAVRQDDEDLTAIRSARLDAGTTMATTPARPVSGSRLVPVASGGMLGLLLATVLLALRRLRGFAAGSSAVTGLPPMLLRLPARRYDQAGPAADGAAASRDRAASLLQALGATAAVGVGGGPADTVAGNLDDRLRCAPEATPRAVLVGTEDTPARSLRHGRAALEQVGVAVAGLVLVGTANDRRTRNRMPLRPRGLAKGGTA